MGPAGFFTFYGLQTLHHIGKEGPLLLKEGRQKRRQTDVRAHGTREMPIWAIAFVRRLGATESPQQHRRPAEFSASLSI